MVTRSQGHVGHKVYGFSSGLSLYMYSTASHFPLTTLKCPEGASRTGHILRNQSSTKQLLDQLTKQEKYQNVAMLHLPVKIIQSDF